jgi:predicted NBD/HSP70 family sugar kinase
LRIGIDLGGTKIELLALGPGGEEVWRRRAPTPSGDYNGTIRCIVELVVAAEAGLGRKCTVGVGIPGTVSPATRLIKNSNSLCLIGHALDKDLARALDRPVRLANDADCFALSEATDGAGADADGLFGVILGTGVGGGLVYDKRLIQGANAIAGEWGHNPLPYPRVWTLADGRALDERPGPPCYCGRAGCIETFLSGPGFARDHQETTGESLAAPDIAEAAKSDAAAAASFDRYIDRLARALAGVINIFDPGVIVLGGGLSQIGALYEEVPKRWERWIFSDYVVTRLAPPRYGDASGVRGAAWLWPADEPSAPGFSNRASAAAPKDRDAT